METTDITPNAAAPAETDDANIARIARQAIVDDKRDVFGYELFDRSVASKAHTAASDAALLFNALSYAGAEALVGKKTVFINCTHACPPSTRCASAAFVWLLTRTCCAATTPPGCPWLPS